MKPQQYITITRTQPLTTLYYEMGRSLLVKGDYNKAVEFLQNAFNNNTENEVPNSDILLTIAAVYTESGNPGLSVKPALLATTYSPEIITRILGIMDTIPHNLIPAETTDWIINSWYPVIIQFETLNNDQKAKLHKFAGDIFKIKNDDLNAEKQFDIACSLVHERGKTFYWDGKYDEACEYFQRAAAIKKDFVLNYWYWADALYLKSYISEKPYSDAAILNKADEVWQTGRSYAKPQKNDAWAYIVKERILTQQNSVDVFTTGNESLDQLREAWMILENSLLLDDTSLNAWRDLANITRLLGLNQVSLEATHKALSIDPNFQFSLEDLALNWLDIAQTEKAREIINRFINDPKTNSPFYYSWLAISYFIESNYKDAIESINKYLSQYPEDDWGLNFLMNCYWRKGRQKDAQVIADKILHLIDNGAKTASLTQSFCYFVQGNMEQAIAIATNTAKRPDQYLNAVEDLQFYCLYKGDTKASENHLDTLLSLSDRPFQLKDILHKNELLLKILRKEKKENHREIIAAITDKKNGFIFRIGEKIKSLEKESYSYFNELGALMKHHTEYNKDGTTGWIAATAALARLTVKYDDPMKAFDYYIQLKKYEKQLPDIIYGFQKTAEQLFINGARECNQSICSAAVNLIKKHPDIYKGIFPSAFAADTIADKIFTSQDDIAFFWKTNSFLDDSKHPAGNDEAFNSFFKSVQLALQKKLEERYNFSYQTNLSHVVTPIMVEMAEALVPATEAADKDWSFIKNDMAQLRASIQSEMGVEIPSILVRPNQYLTGFEYQFVLEEIPVIRYVETPGTIEATLQEAIVHLKSFLLKNLSYFINLDFVFNLLQDWKKSDNDAATIINQLFADDPKKLNRFTKLIQRLFNEMVPVTDWRSLLISANHTGLLQDDVHIDVREARLALKPYLPGNTKDIKTLLLDNNLRSWIIDNLKIKNNKYYFTATPNDTQDWLNNFRDLIATYQQEIIIVIDDNDARPFLKKVIQLEFPAIPVMAQNEFMTDEEIKNWHDKKLTAAGSIDLPTTS